MTIETTKGGEKQKTDIENLLSKYKYRKSKDYETNPIDVFYVRGNDVEVFEKRIIYVEYKLYVHYEHIYTCYNKKEDLMKFNIGITINLKSGMNKYYIESYNLTAIDALKNVLEGNHKINTVRINTDGIKQKMMHSNFFKETKIRLREGGGKVGYLPVLKIQPELIYLVYRDEEIKKTLITLRKQLDKVVILSKV